MKLSAQSKALITIIAILTVAFLLSVKLFSPGEVNVAFVGDILLDRGVEKKILEHGMDYPYRGIKDILMKSDLVFGNLECPLTDGTAGVMKNSRLLFKADPGNSSELEQAGFSVLNLANNHIMDFGQEGLLDTLNALHSRGIRTVGAGRNRDEAVKPVFVKKSGMTVGFLGYSTFPAEGYFFSEDKPDVAHPDMAKTGAEIGKVREKCDFLIVSFHWGREFDFYPGEQQKILAHQAIDSGADLVVGHHPHVLQGMENYKGKLIIYSLGNFIFDRQVPEGTDETMILKIKIQNGKVKKTEILPIIIKDCRPEPAVLDEAKHILDRIQLYSKGLDNDY